MPQRLTDHLNRNTTILSGSSPGMTDSIGSDRRSQPKSLCKSLQTIIEPAESGLIFPICTFIFSLLVAKKDTEQIVGTIRMRRLTVAKPADYILCSIQYFHTHRSFRLDTIIPDDIPFQRRFLQMSKVSERHSAELKHQGSDSLRTTQTFRFGIFIEEAIKFSDRQRFLLANIHSRINIMKQTMHIRSSARLHSSIIDATKHTHIR